EMQRATQALVTRADLRIMAAAPADYRPAEPSAAKRPRANGGLTLELEATPDILGSLKRPKKCVVVGFALEAGGNGLARAQAKLREKDLDAIILNDARGPGEHPGRTSPAALRSSPSGHLLRSSRRRSVLQRPGAASGIARGDRAIGGELHQMPAVRGPPAHRPRGRGSGCPAGRGGRRAGTGGRRNRTAVGGT